MTEREERLRALIAKWRDRARTLCRKADEQPAITGNYAKSLADRAECYDRSADELEAALAADTREAQAAPAECLNCAGTGLINGHDECPQCRGTAAPSERQEDR